MSVHVLIVDALNLIRRIHTVQGVPPCRLRTRHAQVYSASSPHPARWRCLTMMSITKAVAISNSAISKRTRADAGRSAGADAGHSRRM
ncbi:MAG: Flap endonuclease Xni [Sodalis sp.]|nr:MAG: Flap endonuclease Xni [Sodalis sp.]